MHPLSHPKDSIPKLHHFRPHSLCSSTRTWMLFIQVYVPSRHRRVRFSSLSACSEYLNARLSIRLDRRLRGSVAPFCYCNKLTSFSSRISVSRLLSRTNLVLLGVMLRNGIQFLDAPRIRFSQIAERFPQGLSAKFSRPALFSGRGYSTVRPIMATSQVHDSKSPSPPPLFDGTTRLYFSSRCPYAQRVWAAVKYKGLDDIECVEISLSDKPAWYKEKVYPVGKVPSLEHDGKVTGESLDLLTYLDEHFGGPKLAPTEESKKQAAAELIEYSNTFSSLGYTGLSSKNSTPEEIAAVVAPAFDHLENALGKFSSEGPFFLGTLGLVDFVYAPFIERFEIAFGGIRNYDIKAGRPRLTKWIEALDNVEAYSSTKVERSILLEIYRKMLDNDYFVKVGAVADQNKSGGTPVAVK